MCGTAIAAAIVETLERGAAEYGYPKTIRVDNGRAVLPPIERPTRVVTFASFVQTKPVLFP
jgi:hypothetical protein